LLEKRVWARDFNYSLSISTYPKTLIFGCLMAINLFLKKLKGITDPEKKRKIIGDLYVSLFQKEEKK
jgi:GMP synthase PP-ATPase subunit